MTAGRIGAVAVIVGGCASSYQSAHTVSPGTTEITVALTKLEDVSHGNDEDAYAPSWIGDVQLRHGIVEAFDLGFRFVRTPGFAQHVPFTGEPPGLSSVISSFAVDPKLKLFDSGRVAISGAMPVMLGWETTSQRYGRGTLILGPTLFAGFELAPTVEVVVTAKMGVRKYLCLDCTPSSDATRTRPHVGGSLGVRIKDPVRGWAIQPEVGVMRAFHDQEQFDVLVVSFGVGVSASN